MRGLYRVLAALVLALVCVGASDAASWADPDEPSATPTVGASDTPTDSPTAATTDTPTRSPGDGSSPTPACGTQDNPCQVVLTGQPAAELHDALYGASAACALLVFLTATHVVGSWRK